MTERKFPSTCGEGRDPRFSRLGRGRMGPGFRAGTPVLCKSEEIRYGRVTGPRESGSVAAFSFQSFDQGVTGRGTATPVQATKEVPRLRPATARRSRRSYAR